ncbi:MAG: S41 family peptidase [Aggregatilineales bacterium]
MRRRVMVFTTLLLLALFTLPLWAQDGSLPPAEIINDEGGAAILSGEVPYTVTFLSDWGTPSITVSLIDIAGEIDRIASLPDYVVPQDAQVLGQITSDPLRSPFTYEINLPIVPRGEFRDVDNDGADDIGVISMNIQVYTDIFDDPYWESDREYAAGLLSTVHSVDYATLDEIVGGKAIVWAPDNNQGYPSGFGADGLLYTADDPTVSIPQGYSVVDFSTEPFTFDRSFNATVDLIEADQSLIPADYSRLSYTEAFAELIAQMRREYSFAELKNIDFDALEAEFAPRFAQAEADNDASAYQFALRDYILSFPDGHVGPNIFPLTQQDFVIATDSSPGFAMRELDDGRVIVNYLVAGTPADDAGFELGTELIAIDGIPIQEYLEGVFTFGNFSTPHNLHLQQLRYGSRFPRGAQVDITYRNPGDTTDSTITLDTVPERESWTYSSTNNGAAQSWSLPVEFSVLDNGYGYVKINTFGRNPLLALRLWENMIDTLNQQQIPGLIIDMRWNSGGYNLDLVYSGYFFREEVPVGIDELYYPDLNTFATVPNGAETIVLPEDGRYYGGPVAVLVSPSCASACEFFSYAMSLNDRAAIVGNYPTAGLGGNVTRVFMPDGLVMQFTMGRALNADGGIRLEGTGVPPTVQVPITEETLFYEGDVILDYAVDYLNSGTGNVSSDVVTEEGTVNLGDTIEGTLEVGSRDRYTVTVPAEVNQIDIVFNGRDDLVVNLYVPNNNTPVLDPITENAVITGTAGATIIVEIGGAGDAVGGDYSVTVRASEAGAQGNVPSDPPPIDIIDGGAINIGDTVEGDLQVGLRVQYTLTVTADGTVTIEATGADAAVDTYLRVYVDGASEPAFSNDDRASGQLDSLIENIPVTAGQTLTIEVAGFGDGISGGYSLSVNAGG